VGNGVEHDRTHEEIFGRIACSSGGEITYQRFSEALSMLGYAAASDVFGASLYEPCGQIDQIGNLFGAISTNRDTGGYHDKTEELRLKVDGALEDEGNGFLFRDYDSGGLWHGLAKSVNFHRKPMEIREQQSNLIALEFAMLQEVGTNGFIIEKLGNFMNQRFVIIFSTFLICSLLAVVVNVIYGIDIVYTHLFYIPIILTGIWYPRYAGFFAAALGLIHISCEYATQGAFKIGSFFRAVMFMVVANVISYLTLRQERLSGGETFDRLREINPGIKVLLSSGYSIEGQAQEIMDRGCNGFLQKPFRLANLSRKVRELLD
jgi:preprotein translocase subunit YajC